MNFFSDWCEFEQTVLVSGCYESRDELIQLSARTASPSQAFALAYQAALLRLIPNLDSQKWAAFCVSEAQGNHPRQLQAKAFKGDKGAILLTGEKTFVTHGKHAKQLVVIAKSHLLEEPDRLKAYYAVSDNEGITISDSRPAGILPEIDHGKLSLKDAHVTALKGDGHSDYSKRFRLLEDQFMLLVFATHISAKAQSLGLGQSLIEDATALAGLVKLDDALEAPGIIELSELYESFMNLSNQYARNLQSHRDIQLEWQRDSKLFLLAKKARDMRTDKAKAMLAQTTM